MNEYVDHAFSLGFTKAKWLDNINLVCEERLRAFCNSEGCPNHGNNWVCPPGCGSLDSCAEIISHFHKGLLLQSISILCPPVELQLYKELNVEHNQRLKKLIETIDINQFNILTLTSGGCIFCEVCTYPSPCVKPDVRMNSLSAYGIDVGKLCETAGFEYSFRPDRVYYTALILFK